MSDFRQWVIERLIAENLRETDWLELLARLLDYGVICRDESQVEADLYDRYIRLESMIDDYLSMLGLRLHHDSRFQYVRLIPPGARVPGLDDEQDEPFNGGLRTKLSQLEVAVMLTLRAEYDKSLREGQVDEGGCVNLSLESLVLAMKNLLSRTLPESQSERRNLFKRLRQMRVIRFSADADWYDADSWLKIRPMIVHLVGADVVDDIMAASGVSAVAEEPASHTATGTDALDSEVTEEGDKEQSEDPVALVDSLSQQSSARMEEKAGLDCPESTSIFADSSPER